MTQRELAIALKLDTVTVSKWERGVNEPRARALRELSELTGLPVEWFFEDGDGAAAVAVADGGAA